MIFILYILAPFEEKTDGFLLKRPIGRAEFSLGKSGIFAMRKPSRPAPLS